ncbi:inositol polyphosphate multikinase [Paramuricea clavata]|uniref:Kinase n=1 Tax=Paramuricea clavata TaxID=317549 RepID=A0A7D9J3Z4_PARCT|nr:inositol polyphosphate multikinase [Paramuricea clavata]
MLLNGIAMPEGYSVYGHQVAGHRFETGKQGMLLDSDGKLLKPIQAPPRGEREVEFYQSLFECKTSDQTTLKLCQFVPAFYGVKHVVSPDLSLKVDNYIILENLTRHFKKPCILDIKIGKSITDHLATQAKRERAARKYPEQEQFGFRILGMKVYNKSSKHFKFYDKTFGKNLKTHKEVLTGLKEFFCSAEHGKGHIEEILENLEAIKIWAVEQRIFRLYSSSILIIYEGDETLKTNGLVKENSNSDLNANDDTSGDNEMDSMVEDTENAFQFQASDNSCKIQAQLCTETLVAQNECSNCVTDSLVKCWNKRDCYLENNIQPQKPKVNIRLVDFAHTYIGHYDAPDDNYLYGLNNLICYFEQLIR